MRSRSLEKYAPSLGLTPYFAPPRSALSLSGLAPPPLLAPIGLPSRAPFAADEMCGAGSRPPPAPFLAPVAVMEEGTSSRPPSTPKRPKLAKGFGRALLAARRAAAAEEVEEDEAELSGREESSEWRRWCRWFWGGDEGRSVYSLRGCKGGRCELGRWGGRKAGREGARGRGGEGAYPYHSTSDFMPERDLGTRGESYSARRAARE